MAHLLTGDGKIREASLGEYRFARTPAGRVNRMRSALRRVNGSLKTMIEAIADAKLGRTRRDLERRGIRFDPHGDDRLVRQPGPKGHSR